MTDDREDKTLEKQEHFIEIAKSKDVEVLSGRHQFLEFSGNILPITKSGDQLSLYFLPFQENRLAFLIKVPQISIIYIWVNLIADFKLCRIRDGLGVFIFVRTFPPVFIVNFDSTNFPLILAFIYY